MQTELPPSLLETVQGAEADRILRKCVHCGFCLATCPTYQLLGDELDSPRGRIYLIKQMLEGREASASTQLHLDRCLSCRACETTCPSGVEYGRLLDIGRGIAEQRVPRGGWVRVKRWALRHLLVNARVFGFLLRIGQCFRPFLPRILARDIPPRQSRAPASAAAAPTPKPTRRMLVLEGCVKPAATPATNAAARRVLAGFGIELVSAPTAGCCGALDYHLGAHDAGLNRARRNIDAWWPLLQHGTNRDSGDSGLGAEAIVTAASGCGVMVKDYGHLLAQDADYADKAARVSAATRDLGEIIAAEDRSGWRGHGQGRRVAFHSPCTLQHGQQLPGQVEGILRDAGYTLAPVADPHLCCGSAGTYSILQPKLARQLRTNKLAALQASKPASILTANVGCQMHLQARAEVPVQHWIEVFDPGI